MNVADHPIGVGVHQRIAGVLVRQGDAQVVVEGAPGNQDHHVAAQDHHVAGDAVGVVEHAVDQPPRPGVQLDMLQDKPQLVR